MATASTSPSAASSPQPETALGSARSTQMAVRGNGKAPELSANGSRRRKRVIEDGEESSSSRQRRRDPSPESSEQEAQDYDPDQPVQARRNVQRKLRDLQRDLQENQEEYLRADSNKLLDYFKQANEIVTDVKRTSEAAIDSRGLLMAADLAAKQTQLLVSGTVANGVDVDEFVSKCITYMLQGRGIADDDARELSSTQRQRRQPAGAGAGSAVDQDDEEIGDEGDMMNWEHLGRFACLPNVRRPAVQGFLLGPLSLEKKARRATQRTARLKINSLKEVRPQVLDAQDLSRNDKNDLTLICSKILKKLEVEQALAQYAVQQKTKAVQKKGGVVTKEQERKWMQDNHVRDTGGIDMLRFLVNPKSFSQTVENMFYVSFLIRDGKVRLDYDEDGLPSLGEWMHHSCDVQRGPASNASLTESLALESADPDEGEDGEGPARTPPPPKPASSSMKHQAIMSIDMETWRKLIDAFDIKECIIPHRNEDHLQQPGARGWYS
jgi:hypothetical protein